MRAIIDGVLKLHKIEKIILYLYTKIKGGIFYASKKLLAKLLCEIRKEKLEKKEKEDDLFKEWYDFREDKIPGITKEEKKEAEKYYGVLDVAEEFSDFSEENVKRIEEFVDKVKEKTYFEMGYVCDRYYLFGFQDCKKLLLFPF